MIKSKNQQTRFKQVHFIDEVDKIDVEYQRDFLTKQEADNYLKTFEEKLVYNSEKDSQIMIFGKKIPIPRKQIAYGEPGTFYSFSGLKVETKDWNDESDHVSKILREIKTKIEKKTGKDFNFVLINRYANGDDYIGFHADDEKELGQEPSIVGITLGAERPFQLKAYSSHLPKKNPELIEISLAHGSFISMNDPTNKFWKHSVPKRANINAPRISLTFRNILIDK